MSCRDCRGDLRSSWTQAGAGRFVATACDVSYVVRNISTTPLGVSFAAFRCTRAPGAGTFGEPLRTGTGVTARFRTREGALARAEKDFESVPCPHEAPEPIATNNGAREMFAR